MSTVSVSRKLQDLESHVSQLQAQMDTLLSWILSRFGNESGFPTEFHVQVQLPQTPHCHGHPPFRTAGARAKDPTSTIDGHGHGIDIGIEPEVIINIKEEQNSELHLQYHNETEETATAQFSGLGVMGLEARAEGGNFQENDLDNAAAGGSGNVTVQETQAENDIKIFPSSSSTFSKSPTPTITTEYQCQVCGKSFTQRSDFTIHHNKAHLHKKYLFQCSECGEAFSNKRALNRHRHYFPNSNSLEAQVKTQSNNKSIKKAPQAMKNQNPKPRSKPKVHYPLKETKKFPCYICGRELGTKAHMIRHLDIHKDNHSTNKRYQIRIGNQNPPIIANANGNGLPERNSELHLQYHNETEEIATQFSGAGLGQMELETPAEAGNFQVEEQDKDDSYQVEHELPAAPGGSGNFQETKNDIKIFESLSSSSCSLKSQSQTPIATITTEYQCEICGKSFTQRSDFSAHLKLHVNNKQLYQCPECGETFTKQTANHYFREKHYHECQAKNNKNKHTKSQSVPQAKIINPKLTTNTKQRAYYPTNQKISLNGRKTFPCYICGREFGRKAHMIRHLKIHSDNPSPKRYRIRFGNHPITKTKGNGRPQPLSTTSSTVSSMETEVILSDLDGNVKLEQEL